MMMAGPPGFQQHGTADTARKQRRPSKDIGKRGSRRLDSDLRSERSLLYWGQQLYWGRIEPGGLMQVRGWPIAWYRKEDWPRWRAICPDFAADKWLQRAEAGFKQHQDSSHFPEKVVIDPDEFMEWSRVHGREVNGQARSAYAASIIAAQDRPSH